MNMVGLPLLLVTLLMGLGAVVVILISAGARNDRVTLVTLRGSLLWAMGYGAILLMTSLTSEDRLLGHGERKAFCGFYLDCHLGATVIRADRFDRLFVSDSLVSTDGRFIVVDVRIDNDARRMPLGLHDVHAVALDASGRRFRRRTDLEFEMNSEMDAVSNLEAPIPPHGSLLRLFVFEVPRDAGELRMYLSSGNAVDRLLELVLVGDEDSLLHGRQYYRL